MNGSSKVFSSPAKAVSPAPVPMASICNVWKDNFLQEIATISSLITKYPCIAFDTEFPGFPYSTPADREYKRLKDNVDKLKIIQLGLTLADRSGELPPGTATWQFNFAFDLAKDPSAPTSIDLLKTAGLNFEAHKTSGIDAFLFGEFMFTHGMVLNEELEWISFHGTYDFAYFLKLVTCESLPETEAEFQNKLKTYFPHYYDVKCLLKDLNAPSGGLSKVATNFGIKRVGTQHQAGSDSLVTSELFFKLKRDFFHNRIDSKHHNVLYGLDNGIDYDPYSESPEDEAQSYFYGPPGSAGLEGYAEGSPSHTHPAGMYYGSGYYRAPNAYSMGSYFMPPGYPQNTPIGQHMFGVYPTEQPHDGHMQ